MRERDVEKYLKKQLESINAMCLKFVSPQNSGVPDRIVFTEFGDIFFVEVKSPGKTLRKLQQKWKQRLEDRYVTVKVVDSKQSVDDLTERVLAFQTYSRGDQHGH